MPPALRQHEGGLVVVVRLLYIGPLDTRGEKKEGGGRKEEVKSDIRHPRNIPSSTHDVFMVETAKMGILIL